MAVNPQLIHPRLWRASQLAHPHQRTVASGHARLDTWLPGGGWPVGSLIEILLDQPAGLGEIHLLRPALVQTDSTRSLMLLNPPYMPSAVCLQQWFSRQRRVYWIRPQTAADTLWAAEQILRHDAAAALLCWADTMRPQSLHRLHLAASRGSALFFCLRPAPALADPSVAPLRLALSGTSTGPVIRLVKRRGPLPADCISLTAPSQSGGHFFQPHGHGTLDQHPFPAAAHG